MKTGSPLRLLIIITISLVLVGAPEAFAQEGDDPEEPVQAMPKDGDVSALLHKGAPPPKLKTAPSVKATPIKIPEKRTPVIKKEPSVKMTPEPVTGKGLPQVKPTGPRGTMPQSQSGKSGAEVTPRQ